MEIASDDGTRWTNNDAGRFETDVDSVRAKVALLRRVFVRIDVESVVGASLHAGFTTDAEVRIEVDDAIPAVEERCGRADVHAGSVDAVIAPHDREEALGVRPGSLLHVLYPGAVDAKWYGVFGFAGNGAGVATNALILVDYKAVLQRGAPRFFFVRTLLPV